MRSPWSSVTLWGFVGGIFGIVSILLLTFYLLVEADRVFALFVRLFPRRDRNRVSEISELVAVKVSAWLGGQMLLGLIIGTMTAIGLFLMGVPYFFVLAVIAGIGEMIPMVGPLALGGSGGAGRAHRVAGSWPRRRRCSAGPCS